MKLNNKGFAFSTILYGLLIMGIMIILLLMSTMQTNRSTSKELIRTIEQELNTFSLTEAEYRSNGTYTYTVPFTQSGWYKVELWGAKEGENAGSYMSVLLKLEESVEIAFTIGAGPTSFQCRKNCNGIDTGSSIGSVAASSTKYKNFLRIGSVNNSTGRVKIKKVLSYGDTVPSQGEITDGTYYIRLKDQNVVLSKEAIENSSEPISENVNVETFTGEKNQKWTIRKVSESVGKDLYMIYNLADETALQIIEGIDPVASSTIDKGIIDVVAPKKYITSYDDDNNKENFGFNSWELWYIEDNNIGTSVYYDENLQGHYTNNEQKPTYLTYGIIEDYLFLPETEVPEEEKDKNKYLCMRYKYEDANKLKDQQFEFINVDY